MRNHRRLAIFASALALVVSGTAPKLDAGGAVSMHIASGGFGVSVGFGDWSVYTRSWSDPYWSIDFNSVLAGYGQWVWVDGLGRVWRPWVAASWRPYTHGRWVSTGYGWTWVAYEPWGYVPHHYGNWAFCSFGWAWVPGYSYSCANVVWVRAGGYVGWYARPPWGWSHSSHGFRHGYRPGYRDGFGDGYHSGYSDASHDARYGTYVGWRDFGSDDVSRRTVSHRIASQNGFEAQTRAPTNGEIRQHGGAVMTQTRLARRTVTVDGREITIARPEGVAHSIERNAVDTVGRALSEEALEQRQPLVRRRTASAATAAGTSRPNSVARENRSPQEQRPTPASSASRTERSGISARSSDDRSSTAGSAATRTNTRASSSSFGARQERDDGRQSRPRTGGQSRVTDNYRSRSAPSTSARPRSTAASRQVARRPQQTSQSKRPQVRVRQTVTERRQAAPVRQRAADSERTQSRTEPSTTTRKKKHSAEKSSEEPARRRRR